MLSFALCYSMAILLLRIAREMSIKSPFKSPLLFIFAGGAIPKLFLELIQYLNKRVQNRTSALLNSFLTQIIIQRRKKMTLCFYRYIFKQSINLAV
ncbi:hypothetical protein lerEdw1_000495 [Lerista edwardsae]|nr:hypothetical protein lerEdw1_000495 [Lerista edwardsae]